MKYLDSVFPINIKQLDDNYCIFAANAVRVSQFTHAEIYMRMSLEIRLIDAALFKILSLGNPIYDSVQEPSNIHKLKNI